MNSRTNKQNLLNSRLIKLLLSSFFLGLPVLVTVEARANMQENMPSGDMTTEETTQPESGVYNNIDGGYDGEPVTTIPETEGTIDVILKNNTNAAIDYQAIGYTENQTIEGGEEYTLQGLPVPVVIRAARQDDGFVATEPMINENGVLEISLDEAGERNLGVVRIEEDGEVYINQDSEASTDMENESMPKENPNMDQDANANESSGYNSSNANSDGEPIATVIPIEGTINVRLNNNTNAAIDYQAIGYTENQTLQGGEKHTMVNLPVPVVIRSARQDDGFIKILPLADKDKDGVLEVNLDEDPEFYDDNNLGVVRIEEDGSVFVN